MGLLLGLACNRCILVRVVTIVTDRRSPAVQRAGSVLVDSVMLTLCLCSGVPEDRGEGCGERSEGPHPTGQHPGGGASLSYRPHLLLYLFKLFFIHYWLLFLG